MKLPALAVAALAIAFSISPSPSSAAQPKWRIVPTKYPTADVVIAGFTVQEFGAKGDGSTDDTAAFQAALDAMADAGGGTVFAPRGRYAIRGNLTVPATVTLRGEWQQPALEKGGLSPFAGTARRVLGTKGDCPPFSPTHGTLLLVYAGRGKAEGKPFLAMKTNAGLKDLNVWYPEQDAGKIVPYPFTIEYHESASIEGLTLINSYQAINDPVGSTYVIRNVYATALATGIRIDNCTDTGRIENVHFSPAVWSRSGLPGAPAADGPHARWIAANGTALRFFRIDWNCGAYIFIDGYKVGIEMLASKAGPSYGHFYKSAIVRCANAVFADVVREPGFLFTDCLLEGSDTAVTSTPRFSSFFGFHSCTLRGGNKAVALHGTRRSAALFHRCTLEGTADCNTGDLALLGCTFHGNNTPIAVGPSVRAATIAGSHFDRSAQIVNHSPSSHIRISDDAVPESKIPQVPQTEDRILKPARAKLYVVTNDVSGNKNPSPLRGRGAGVRGNVGYRDGSKFDATTDATAAIQKTLDAAAADGGGIVFLPAGEYNVQGHLTVPPGVELRGIYDIAHHCLGKGSALRLYAGRGDESTPPAIVMQKHSGMRGLTILYPQQRYDSIVPYPYTIQGRGEDIYVVNLTAINSYKILDFMTYRCDRHYLDRVFGAPLRVGIAVGGGSVGGQVRNANLNPGWWTLSPYPDCPGTPDRRHALSGDPNQSPVLKYVMENLDAMLYGDCTGELEFAAAICPERYGVHFVMQNGRGASGVFLAHASDSAEVTALFDGLAPAGVDFINTNLANYNPAKKRYCGDDFRSEARFYNLATWGMPDRSAVVKSGSLLFELAHFNQYAPFEIDGGKLTLTGVLLSGNVPKEKELLIHSGGRVSLLGTISAHGMRRGAEAPAAAVTSRFETEHSLPAQPTGAGPIAAWMLDEAQGTTAADSTGNGHRGTIRNAQWQKGSFGTALQFNGNSQVLLSTKGMPEFKALAVEAWVCPQQLGPFQNLIDWAGRLEFRINDTREANRFACFLRLADGSMEPRVSSALAADANQWQHVAVVWDGVYLQLWVNGQLQAESERCGTLRSPADSPLTVGRGFHGLIRAIRLYNRPLAEAELRQP